MREIEQLRDQVNALREAVTDLQARLKVPKSKTKSDDRDRRKS